MVKKPSSNTGSSRGVKRSITEVQHPDAGGIGLLSGLMFGGEIPSCVEADQMHLHTNTLRDRGDINNSSHTDGLIDR